MCGLRGGGRLKGGGGVWGICELEGLGELEGVGVPGGVGGLAGVGLVGVGRRAMWEHHPMDILVIHIFMKTALVAALADIPL